MPDYRHEEALIARGFRRVCGIDEVGRGPWAGPVIAAAAVIDLARLDPDVVAAIDDSKRLSKTVREQLAAVLEAEAEVALGVAEVEEIDRVNVLEASLRAMARAVAGLHLPPTAALVDGNRAPTLACETETVIEGDGRCLSIAAASIVAKVARDRLMAELGDAFPGYGWERNAGYGTAEHRAALERLGVTPHHRRSFKPIINILRSG